MYETFVDFSRNRLTWNMLNWICSEFVVLFCCLEWSMLWRPTTGWKSFLNTKPCDIKCCSLFISLVHKKNRQWGILCSKSCTSQSQIWKLLTYIEHSYGSLILLGICVHILARKSPKFPIYSWMHSFENLFSKFWFAHEKWWLWLYEFSDMFSICVICISAKIFLFWADVSWWFSE